jgi:hypothetical protein
LSFWLVQSARPEWASAQPCFHLPRDPLQQEWI